MRCHFSCFNPDVLAVLYFTLSGITELLFWIWVRWLCRLLNRPPKYMCDTLVTYSGFIPPLAQRLLTFHWLLFTSTWLRLHRNTCWRKEKAACCRPSAPGKAPTAAPPARSARPLPLSVSPSSPRPPLHLPPRPTTAARADTSSARTTTKRTTTESLALSIHGQSATS